jgi:hypothetical protein
MTAIKRNFDLDGVRYYYTVSADPRNPGEYSYGVQLFVLNDNNIPVDNASAFTSSIPTTINEAVGKLQRNIIELEQRAATQQETLARLEQELQNPNLTPTERTALQLRIDEFKNGTIAETQVAIAGNQRAIAELQNNSTAIFQDMQGTLAESLVPPTATPTIDNTASPGVQAPSGSNALPSVASDDSGQQQPNSVDSSPIPDAADLGDMDTLLDDDGDSSSEDSEARNESTEGFTDLGEPGTPPYENEGFIRIPISSSGKPGRRLKNSLGYLASYTYQISLYMITPKAYEAFIKTGRKDVTIFNRANVEDTAGGAYLIAQSAGMGSPEQRAPEFELDYYIDNLTFTHQTAAQASAGPLVKTDYKFRITEPYGFSFVSKLAKAQKILEKTAGGPNLKNYKGNMADVNTTKNFFIIGIRFFGWDKDGNQLLGNEEFDGEPLDPNTSGTGALFETYNEIVFSEFKFKIDGRSTVYDVKAQPIDISSTVNVTKGTNPDNKSVSGRTVRDLLVGPEGLLTKLNNEEKKLFPKSVDYPITYKIQWLGDDVEQLAVSPVVTDNMKSKMNLPGSNAKNTNQSNDGLSIKSTPNTDSMQTTIGKVPITQAIEQIFVRSKFMLDALSKNYEDANQVDPETNEPKSEKGSGKKLVWFNISPKITNIQWDKKRKDWAYDIVYVIQTYLVPGTESNYVTNKTKYYGPHKRYDYWYTGQNTEIIGYEQRVDNNFFLATYTDPDNENDDENNTNKKAVNRQSAGDKSGAKNTPANEAINNFRTSLYSPDSFATAKIQILGDPDFIMHDTASVDTSSTGSITYNKFYDSDGTTINPTGGQVFIEIDFKEAVDYSVDGINELGFGPDGDRGVTGEPGTMSINDSIEFWRFEDEDIQKEVNGIPYQIISVTNNLTNGSFTQTISAVINQGLAADSLSEEGREEARSEGFNQTEEQVAEGDADGLQVDKKVTNEDINQVFGNSILRPEPDN